MKGHMTKLDQLINLSSCHTQRETTCVGCRTLILFYCKVFSKKYSCGKETVTASWCDMLA